MSSRRSCAPAEIFGTGHSAEQFGEAGRQGAGAERPVQVIGMIQLSPSRSRSRWVLGGAVNCSPESPNLIGARFS
jgi:hypothetical protein